MFWSLTTPYSQPSHLTGDSAKHDKPENPQTYDVDPSAMINSVKTKISGVSFSETVETCSVPAYNDIYGIHPRFICATCDGWKVVKSDADPYTGKSGAIMQARHTEILSTSSRA